MSDNPPVTKQVLEGIGLLLLIVSTDEGTGYLPDADQDAIKAVGEWLVKVKESSQP